jgi:hypothetical protein
MLQPRVMEGPRRKDANVHLLLKHYYLLIIVIEKCYYKKKHINAIGGLCHGNIFQGDKVTFIAHVSRALKDFVLKNLQLGFFVSQSIAKHHKKVQHIVETSGCLTRETFLCEQHICNIEGKLAKETYKKHENDEKVRM